jgi:hypothetical protein
LSGWEYVLGIPDNDDGYIEAPYAYALEKCMPETIPHGEGHAQVLRGCIKLVYEWDGSHGIHLNRATS